MNTKAKLVIAALAAVVAIVLLSEGVLIPKQLQPDVLPLRFKQYQDDTTLTAVFEIDNEADSPVVVWESVGLITHGNDHKRETVSIERTQIPRGSTALIAVPVPRDCPWQVEFSVARFGPKQQKQFQAGEEIKGTVVISEVVPEYDPNKQESGLRRDSDEQSDARETSAQSVPNSQSTTRSP